MLEWPILRQFSSPCSIVRYLDSFQVPARYARYARVFKSLLDMLDSFLATPPTTRTDVLFYRIWWLSPPHWTMLEWPILRQFSSPCSIVRYLDSFQVPPRYARQFSSPCSICSTVFARYARQFLKTPPTTRTDVLIAYDDFPRHIGQYYT